MKNYNYYRPIIEALLFVSGDEGVTNSQVAHLLEEDVDKVVGWIEQIKCEYENNKCGFQIMVNGSSYCLVTNKIYAPYIKKFVKGPDKRKMSQAALETVAIIAYNQPITKIEVEKIRGVATDTTLQHLLNRGIVCEVGRSKGMGRAILYGTTDIFLNYFGLNCLSDLPPLPDRKLFDEQEVDLFQNRRNI